MSIIAEFSIPPEGLPGGDVLAELSDLRVELERVVPTEESALPYFWLLGDDTGSFIERARAEDEIETIRVLEDLDEYALVRARWTPDAEIIEAIKALRATLLEARGTDDGWEFRVRAERRDNVSLFRQTFRDHGISVELDRIYGVSEMVAGSQYELTPEQRETLLTAYEAGYYDKPRAVTQRELGEEFGITARAVSDRLRRGMANLIANTLASDTKNNKRIR